MFYLRIALLGLWLVISSALGLVVCLFRWGDLNLDRYFAHLWGWGALKISGIHLAVDGMAGLERSQPCIYVANHQSNLDMATYGSFYPHRTIVIGKKELLWVPVFGLLFVAAGNILIDRNRRTKAVAGLSQAVK